MFLPLPLWPKPLLVFRLNYLSALLTGLSSLTLTLMSALYTTATASLHNAPSHSQRNSEVCQEGFASSATPCKLRFPLGPPFQSLWSWFSEKPSTFDLRTFAFAVPVPKNTLPPIPVWLAPFTQLFAQMSLCQRGML